MIVSPGAHRVRSYAIGAEDRSIGAHLLEICARAGEAAVLVGACLHVVRLPCRVAGIAENKDGCNCYSVISYTPSFHPSTQPLPELAETMQYECVSSQTNVDLR